jgi:hypothetical protein
MISLQVQNHFYINALPQCTTETCSASPMFLFFGTQMNKNSLKSFTHVPLSKVTTPKRDTVRLWTSPFFRRSIAKLQFVFLKNKNVALYLPDLDENLHFG